ncbi:MAG: tetraacyldisaccharide 4'-kinase [Bacteroidaceae bacterium]|nr:tetraacyldisaccharide 4'-kinase [Bacteroidaceae bacterium]
MIEKKKGITATACDVINPYRWITALRNSLFDLGIMEEREFPVPTICIGNISVGGTGKTPHTEYLIELLGRRYRTAVLSRGYGRKSKGYIKGTPSTPMEILGDEPFQIKNKFPHVAVAVCEKRADGIEKLLAENNSPEVILLDDAYQHRHVKAGMNILLIDSNRPIWQDCVLPFGRMRESLAGIKRADIVVITKCNGITVQQKAWCRNFIKGLKEISVFFSNMEYGMHYPLFKEAAPLDDIAHCDEALLVTGIARPEPLKEEINKRGVKVEVLRFGDHHNFTTADIERIAKRFNSMKGKRKAIITTEKDATRLIQRNDLPQCVRENIYAIPIQVVILDGEKDMFNQIIENYVTENSRNR